MTFSDTFLVHTFSQCTISQAPFLNTVVSNEGGGGGEGSSSQRERGNKQTVRESSYETPDKLAFRIFQSGLYTLTRNIVLSSLLKPTTCWISNQKPDE